MNILDNVEDIEVDLIREALTTIEILSLEDIIYIVINVGMGNYLLYENAQVIFISTEKEQ